MRTWLPCLAGAAFMLIVVWLGAYVALELRLLCLSRRTARREDARLARAAHRRVSVLLPVHNEAAVVERLIDAVCALRYPRALLEILVLDDSTDHTSALARDRVEHHERLGVNIRLLRRPNRGGYKAGNLMHGLEVASGAFYVILDADFLLPEDFLLECMPCFDDPGLGFLQTAIGYENAGASLLTRFQVMEMRHQQGLAAGLGEAGGMATLSGSSCIWRRACVLQLGGWNAETATEDVDLAYRAQLEGWRYAYLGHVVSMSLLPETVSAFRIQRERWGRGLIQCAVRHAPGLARRRMPLSGRLHALSAMFSPVLLASMYLLVLLAPPLAVLVNVDGLAVRVGALVFFALVTVWSLGHALGARRRAGPGERMALGRLLWNNYLYIALFLPLAWYYFAGGVRGACGAQGHFLRTPKGGAERAEARPVIDRVLMTGECLTFCYALAALALALRDGCYILAPLDLTACVGFGMVLYWSWREARLRQRG